MDPNCTKQAQVAIQPEHLEEKEVGPIYLCEEHKDEVPATGYSVRPVLTDLPCDGTS